MGNEMETEKIVAACLGLSKEWLEVKELVLFPYHSYAGDHGVSVDCGGPNVVSNMRRHLVFRISSSQRESPREAWLLVDESPKSCPLPGARPLGFS